MWEYMTRPEIKGEITALQVASALADRWYGYGISYSANELLKDLNLLTEKGVPNKRGREVVAIYLHEKYHRNFEGIKIIKPKTKPKKCPPHGNTIPRDEGGEFCYDCQSYLD